MFRWWRERLHTQTCHFYQEKRQRVAAALVGERAGSTDTELGLHRCKTPFKAIADKATKRNQGLQSSARGSQVSHQTNGAASPLRPGWTPSLKDVD